MIANRYNLDVLEDAYERWQKDRESVDPSWQPFFEGFELGAEPTITASDRVAQIGVVRLIQAYRDLGHLQAHLNPLAEAPPDHPHLALHEFGLSESDLEHTFDTSVFHGLPQATLTALLAALRETYCRTIGVEFMHIQDRQMRRWLCSRMEPRRNQPGFARRQKLRILMDLHYTQIFEQFLHARYIGQKRFSLEGAETLIPMLDAVVEKAGDAGVREIVLGMAHRGRLNVLANVMGKPYGEIFAEFEDSYPGSVAGDGDVKYHLGFSSDRTTPKGAKIHLSLTPNPSHLEAVDPVVEGRTRAKQHLHGDNERNLGIPLLIHGDAAFAGQGIVAETLNLSQLQGYTTGGTVHVIVNNQVGFTTSPADARSTHYCTDMAKMLQAPIFHVNGEDPEAAVYVAELAFDFRQTFHQDVLIDLLCYRRYGHNEGDEPSFTQPIMYRQIEGRPSVTELYTEQMIDRGDLTEEDAEAIDTTFHDQLVAAQEQVKSAGPTSGGMRGYAGRWQGMSPLYSHEPVETGVPARTLEQISERLSELPEDFTAHAKLQRMLHDRHDRFRRDEPVDWGFAESLAFGSLLLEGVPVRLTGQDSRRGTFSHRHAVLFDAQAGRPYVPLDHLAPDQAVFRIYDSPLAEASVVGFEFGYSLEDPNFLVLWEAQFGDFVNGAQVILDQYLVCSQSKWQRDSGLVLLLPHGYEGQGAEHSSARLERILQACAEDNIQVCQPTSPAQYFHLLRRQIKRNFRKPLIVLTPKSLLRHKGAVSPVKELASGRFHEVLADDTSLGRASRVLLCSGKIYYELRAKAKDDVAVIRVEQFYPFPEEPLRNILKQCMQTKDWFWVQDESQNMGGWFFMEDRMRELGYPVQYIGRDASASPATGSHHVHDHEQKELIEAAMMSKGTHLVRSGSRP